MGFMGALRTATKEVEISEITTKEAPSESVVDPVDFIFWTQTEADRISALPDSEQEQALTEFESRCARFDALPDSTKQQALSMSMPKESVVASPFDAGCIGADWPVVIEDLDNPGQYVARYSGTLTPVGYGKNEYDALHDLQKKDVQ